ncbi:MAG: type IX secretion system membrane protein PorP/SprF [Bacteroidota bacterium]
MKKDVLLSRFLDEPDTPLLNLPFAGKLPKPGIKRFFILILLVFQGGLSLYAQQSTLITHYMFTNMAMNPAFAGNSGGISATGLVRQQWIGWKDADGTKSAPQTYLFTVDSPFKFLHGGAGLSISQDQIGVFKNTVLKLAYAYKLEMGSGDLSIGLQGNLQNISYDVSKFKGIDSDDPLLSGLQGKTSAMMFDLGTGVYYKVPEKYYLGFSVDNLLQTRSKKLAYELRRTFYLTGGYQWVIPGHPEFELLPSALVMYDGAAFQLNASALVSYNNKFYGGLGYRLQDAVSLLAGVLVKSLRIGVAYDISTSAMHKYNSGGLEVMVNYCFKIDVDKFRKSYRNTRFL